MMRDIALIADYGWMRASDRDRDMTVAVLGDAYVAGRLGLNELCDRTTAACTARTWDDLCTLTADIPAGWHQDRWRAQLEANAEFTAGTRHHTGQRPFTPMALMGVLWLIIALAAPVPVALMLPLVLLALFGIWAAGWKAGR